MAPAAGHHKFADGFAHSRRGLALPQFFREACRIAWITDGNGRNRVPAFGDGKDFPRALRIETSHLMNGKAAGDCFDGKQRGCGAGIVLCVAIWGLVRCECKLADRDGEGRGVFRPSRVELDEHAEYLLEIFRIVAGGGDIRPGLLVVAGRRPASGFKKAAQDLGGDEGLAKRARTPAVAEQFMNRKFDWRRFLHSVPFDVPKALLRGTAYCSGLRARTSSRSAARVFKREAAMWRNCRLCSSRTGLSSVFRIPSPRAVMRVLTTRRSSDWRSRVMRLRFSIRSRRRVISGSCEIIRSPICRQARPSGSAPRRIRSTLYWTAVRPEVFMSCSISRPRESAVLSSAIKTRFSMGGAGRLRAEELTWPL